jgi:hypothetical protein
MKVLLWVVASASVLLAVDRQGFTQDGNKEASERKLISLVKVEDFPTQHREAAKAVATALKDRKEDPREFYAGVEAKNNGDLLVFHLWHQSAFHPKNRDVPGNPGGKCRDAFFDTKKGKVADVLFWQ